MKSTVQRRAVLVCYMYKVYGCKTKFELYISFFVLFLFSMWMFVVYIKFIAFHRLSKI